MTEELSQEQRERVLRALPHDVFAGPPYQVGLRRRTIAARTSLDVDVVDDQLRRLKREGRVDGAGGWWRAA
jgi:hypothetical protein